mmetsp:Transcript_18221/g.37927  ORF Transcript_18221/g.37927 Transcript_18221/m.37927 type:complete len:377 (-) Transcript_18221:139-1269(-)
MTGLLDGAIMTIFAREVLEGTVIIGQYRTVLLRSDDWQEPEKQKQGLKAITYSALLATFVAIIVCACVAIPLAVLSRDLDEKVADIIEGVSKLVAAICILQLSLKIPKFLGIYASKKGADGVTIGLSLKSVRFNVAWNIWREVAEIGVFLIPFFLQGEGAKAIPLSGLIGIAVGFLLGAIIYFGNKKLKNKAWLAAFMVVLLVFLSTGLFVGGCHEFEEVYGETPKVYDVSYKRAMTETIDEDATDEDGEVDTDSEEGSDEGSSDEKKEYSWRSHKRLPMALVKPFGYSSSRTQLQIACFWSWLVLSACLHLWKLISTRKIRQAEELAEEELNTGKALGDGEGATDRRETDIDLEQQSSERSSEGDENVQTPVVVE